MPILLVKICIQDLTLDITMETNEEKYYVQDGMLTYGGSFVKALGEALTHADAINVQKIKDTWPKYWSKYLVTGIYKEENKK